MTLNVPSQQAPRENSLKPPDSQEPEHRVPAAQLRRINETEGVGSVKRESKHFSDNTSLHGPKRIYYGKRCSFAFWIAMVTASFTLLVLQTVSFVIKDEGMDFPLVTLCNFNPVRKTYVQQVNQTGDFTDDLLNYLMEYLTDANQLYGAADRETLHVGQKALDAYVAAHPNFTAYNFFMDAGKNRNSNQSDPDPLFTEMYENGFRYYVHPPKAVPYLTSEGISYVLLPSERWGNCTARWPTGFHSSLPYSAVNCDSICKADYFNSVCGCSPFSYDIEDVYQMCSPFETVRCIDDNIRKKVNGVDSYNIPKCSLCRMECESVVYHAYNSYGDGFNNGDIGGNMGMFLGMSLITVAEVLMYFSKVGWLTISKKRRDYMSRKLIEKTRQQSGGPSYYDEDPQQQRGSVVELKVNLRDLEHHDDRICRVKANYCSRPRSSTAPPSRNNF
ncbi:unnamed protein product [Nippostrongylus brasiliensis]|uniref:Amiloride-sensitive sodium channel n=1 Tax=Nippostrongylus brasiliensis TaxID=27835 RepID=A0A158R0J9_NIPBR|nr:unnamed protein product [Nippostrongylus brasiliensis]